MPFANAGLRTHGCATQFQLRRTDRDRKHVLLSLLQLTAGYDIAWLDDHSVLCVFSFRVCLQPSKPLASCIGHQGPVTQATFLPAAAAAAAACDTSTTQQQQQQQQQQHSKALPLLLTGSDDWTARVWDATTGSCHAVCVGHGGAVTAAAAALASSSSSSSSSSGAGMRLVTGAADGSVAVWGLRGELHGMMQQHAAPVRLLAQGDDTLVSGELDNSSYPLLLARGSLLTV
jgi:WD40 repeat protein